MPDASIRDLRHRGGEIVDLAASGEAVTITRDGKPVAQLRAIPGESLSAVALLARWRGLPDVDPVTLRSDIDAVVDPQAW
ncbi:MAG: type II toxin-antitoxin system prevent-host-death family antitoxin [Solirubrobacteraceae bacterium]|nr:type II toxin-antitoxin system prevent-host-death family antitoxin [Solirubrobacteraceae bacterium]